MESPIDLTRLDIQPYTPPIREAVNLILPLHKYSFPQLITKETCSEYRKSFPQSNQSNVYAWHSGLARVCACSFVEGVQLRSVHVARCGECAVA